MQPAEPAFPTGEGGLVRLRLELEYDGTGFAGWASQPGLRTVQQVLEAALSTLFRVPRVAVVVAGRTDTGVHATGQVCHCDVEAAGWAQQRGPDRPPAGRAAAAGRPGACGDRGAAGLRRPVLRALAPLPVPDLRRRLRRAGAAPARHGGLEARPWTPPPCTGPASGCSACTTTPPSAGAGRAPPRCAGWSSWRCGARGELVEIEVQADAFCHSMVRSLVGALAAVGEGSRDEDWPYRLLSLGERSDHITVAPARGLTLVAVGYPAEAELAARARPRPAASRPRQASG